MARERDERLEREPRRLAVAPRQPARKLVAERSSRHAHRWLEPHAAHLDRRARLQHVRASTEQAGASSATTLSTSGVRRAAASPGSALVESDTSAVMAREPRVSARIF